MFFGSSVKLICSKIPDSRVIGRCVGVSELFEPCGLGISGFAIVRGPRAGISTETEERRSGSGVGAVSWTAGGGTRFGEISPLGCSFSERLCGDRTSSELT
jgi:hypothetical protein